MKSLLILSLFSLSLFSMDEGELMYSSCKFCHGIKGEKIYENIVPSLKNQDVITLEVKLRLYKEGDMNTYGYGPIMKQQMANIPDEKISILAKYINNL